MAHWLGVMVLAMSLAGCAAEPEMPAAKGQRSRSVRQAFQHQQPCPATGKTSGACPGYVVDHIVPLACGGADAPDNMQWQTVEAAKAKDRWERVGCSR